MSKFLSKCLITYKKLMINQPVFPITKCNRCNIFKLYKQQYDIHINFDTSKRKYIIIYKSERIKEIVKFSC